MERQYQCLRCGHDSRTHECEQIAHAKMVDLQRALDAEREKVAKLEKIQAIDLKNNNEYREQLATLQAQADHTRIERNRLWGELADLQAQLADRDAMILQMGKQAARLAKDGIAAKAQLRQVEGQSQQQAEEAVIVFAKYTTLRQLVSALPVAGLPVEHARSDDFVVLQANGEWMVHTYNYWAKFATEDEARAYIALLEYRASLPAQPAQGGA